MDFVATEECFTPLTFPLDLVMDFVPHLKKWSRTKFQMSKEKTKVWTLLRPLELCSDAR